MKNNEEQDLHKECSMLIMPVRDALDLLSGKWKLPIIIALKHGNTRFKDIQRSIPKITPRMLSKELKELEMNKLVTRQVYDTLPVTVEYTLTDYSKSLDKVIGELFKWGQEHRKVIIGKKKRQLVEATEA